MKFFTPFLTLFIFLSLPSFAQQDPEYPSKEFIMHLKWQNGMVTNFKGSSPDQYVGGLQIIPQYTLVKNLMRGGVAAGVLYTGKKLQAIAGPTVSVKLVTFKAKPFGSLGNLSLNLDHLWGKEKERLLGGGINADLGNKLIISLSAHRDYNLHTWWLQNGISFRISKIKKPKGNDIDL